MNPILLDTHIFIWFVSGNEIINKQARKNIENAAQSNQLFLADISLWEISMLVEKQRIILEMPYLDWMNRAIDALQLQIKMITPNIAIESSQLANFHGDPADRLIVATARVEGFTLVTRDSTILNFSKKTKLLSIMKA